MKNKSILQINHNYTKELLVTVDRFCQAHDLELIIIFPNAADLGDWPIVGLYTAVTLSDANSVYEVLESECYNCVAVFHPEQDGQHFARLSNPQIKNWYSY